MLMADFAASEYYSGEQQNIPLLRELYFKGKQYIVAMLIKMNLGVCRIKIRLPENQSLKGKRRVLNSLITRIRNKYNVAIAEVDDQELWQLATLGIACISNSTQHTDEILAKVVEFVSRSRLDIEILDYEVEIIPFH